MSNQIKLEWSVDATGTTFTPAQAAAALAAVVLYTDPTTDPLLGQALGLTVAADTIVAVPPGAKRTLLLNMKAVMGAPFAPPPFPCHPTAQTPPVLPYVLERRVGLAGSFTVTSGSAIVPTSANQTPSLNNGDKIQFASELGVDYTILNFTPTALTLTSPYTGPFATSTNAFKVLPAPAKLPALYSTSPLDSSPNGSGTHLVVVTYIDSLGAPGTATTGLSGKRPSQLTLQVGTIDIAVVTGMNISSNGFFANSVGQITLTDLSAPIAFDDTDDEAQMKISGGLVYLPPSYFSLVQQGASQPTLVGDFKVVPGSTGVVPTVDQTGALAPGNTLQFVTDPTTIYTVTTVTPGIVTLTTPYEGLLTAVTSATRLTPQAATSPTSDQIKALLAQYTNPGNVLPSGAMVPAPVFLSDLFTQTISVALAVPVTPSPIALL